MRRRAAVRLHARGSTSSRSGTRGGGAAAGRGVRRGRVAGSPGGLHPVVSGAGEGTGLALRIKLDRAGEDLGAGVDARGPRPVRGGSFQIDEGFRDLPDHIAAELEFLYLLDFRALAAHLEGDEMAAAELAELRERFLAGHLERWAGAFAEAVQAGAECEFYRVLADFAVRFIGLEAGARASARGTEGRGSPPRRRCRSAWRGPGTRLMAAVARLGA